MIRKIALSFFALFYYSVAFGQYWTEHLDMSAATFSGKLNDKLVAGNAVGLFTYHLDDYLLEKISTVNLLSGVDITAVKTLDNRLFIGYQNGNVDVISNGSVVNIPDIKLSTLVFSKKINNFMAVGNLLYCCTDFGIVVINIEKHEVADTYYIGTASDRYAILGLAIDKSVFYAATEKGIFRADPLSGSLSYYETWKNIGGDILPYKDVFLFDGTIVAVRSDNNSEVTIRSWHNDAWQTIGSVSNFVNAVVADDGVLLAASNAIWKMTADSRLNLLFSQYVFQNGQVTAVPSVGSLSVDDDGERLVIGDLNYGMVYCDYQGSGIHVSPNAPRSNSCFRLAANANGVYVAAGGLSSDWNNMQRPFEFSYYAEGKWSSYVRPSNENYIDLINIAIDPSDPSSVYMSSWGSGVIKVNESVKEKHFNQFNSLLQNIEEHSSTFVRVGGLCFDNNSNLFMSNAEVKGGLLVKTSSNDWYRLNYTPTEMLHSIGNFVYSRDNILWAAIPRVNRGLFVLSVNGTIADQSDDQYRSVLTKTADPNVRNRGQLQIWDENHEVITNSVFAICEDMNGQIWLGTDKGVVVYYRPSTILKEDYPVASRIKVPCNDGTNAADYLLGNEKITCMAVDGANRKWIGTESSGLFLVSPDGLETIHSFNDSNSPLYSNSITSLAVHPKSGEVFIGTSKGLISFKGDAIAPEKEISELHIYPNPVRENFLGNIAIEGFSSDSEVIITDVSGGLVYKSTSLGGRVTWNGKNLNGVRVKTGVYLILATDKEGKKGVAGKVLVVK